MNKNNNPVKKMNKMALLLLAGSLVLTACGAREGTTDAGGGADSGGGPVASPVAPERPGGGNPDQGAAQESELTITVRTSESRLTTGSDDEATIRATVVDADNRAVPDQAISFSSSGGALQDISSATDERGEATALLSLTTDLRNNPISVTVRARGAESTVVVGAGGTELTVQGDESVVLGNPVELLVSLKDGTGQAIANEIISFTSSQSNVITPAEAVTDADGRVMVSVASDEGSDTINVSTLSDTVTKQFEFLVSADQLDFVDVDMNPVFAVGETEMIDVRWMSQGLPVPGSALQVSTTAGQLEEQVIYTNSQGIATLGISASSASDAQIKVSSLAPGGPTDTLQVTFAALNPAALELASSVARVNTGTSSEITATVLDSNDNPVLGKRVVFASDDLRGGQLASGFATTDSKGKATVQFNAGSAATEEDAISITATVDGTTITGSTTLTIVKKTLNVTMGTANLILRESDNAPQYYLDFVVQVADGSGAPLENADVYLSIEPTHYFKGQFVRVDQDGDPRPTVAGTEQDAWNADRWGIVTSRGCEAEDRNNNNILDLDATPSEDFNNNQRLDPQDPASLAASLEPGVATLQSGGFLQTDATGSGYFRMIYPVSNASWARVVISAAARELGAESVTYFTSGLPVNYRDVQNENISPPNHFSPYGQDTSTCANED